MPGLDGTDKLFKPVLEYFREHQSLCISYPKNNAFSYSDYAKYVLSKVPFKTFHIVAESFSGPVAIEILKRHKQNIKSITFVSSFVKAPINPIALKILSHLCSIPFRPKKIIKFLLLGKSLCPAYFFDVISKISAHDLKKRLQLIANYQCDFNFDVPSIYLNGVKDKLIQNSGFTYLKKWAKKISLITFDGPHLLLQTKPKATSQKIISFASLHD